MEENREVLAEEKVKFDYTGYDTTVAYRLPDEPYEDYKLRRKIGNYIFKERLKGVVTHQSRQHIYDKEEKDGGKLIGLGKGLTYVKAKQ